MEEMETENKKNGVFLYMGAFLFTAASLSMIALMLMLLYISF
jgi:hypothetical protein